MKITIVGTGYVGLVTGTCFAEMGTQVTCVDVDSEKIESLKKNIIPIFEPGLEELVARNVYEKRLCFTTSLKDAIKDTSIIFSAVGTPPDEDGSADLSFVLDVAKTVGQYATDYFILITKSTVPVGTSVKVREVIEVELKKRNVDIQFDVASNPEFLKEGSAIKDFRVPDRVVIGVDNVRSKRLLSTLYKPFTLNGFPVIFMDIASAEMAKYAANAMLATRISFMNEIANLCELVGADVDMVRKGIASDPRIGSKFLYAGAGYGGSCFPKDVKALSKIGSTYHYPMLLIDAVERVNDKQKMIIFNKLEQAFGGKLKGKVVAIWGLSFKPETDDMREAPSLVVIENLMRCGAIIKVFDPVAMVEAKRRLGDNVIYCENIYDAVIDADAIAVVTEWKQFRLPDWVRIKRIMRGDVIVDGRNIYDQEEILSLGFNYFRIGKN